MGRPFFGRRSAWFRRTQIDEVTIEEVPKKARYIRSSVASQELLPLDICFARYLKVECGTEASGMGDGLRYELIVV